MLLLVIDIIISILIKLNCIEKKFRLEWSENVPREFTRRHATFLQKHFDALFSTKLRVVFFVIRHSLTVDIAVSGFVFTVVGKLTRALSVQQRGLLFSLCYCNQTTWFVQ